MPVQGSVHNVQRAPHQTLGTRTRRRGRADAARSEPASHACAPRNRRASVLGPSKWLAVEQKVTLETDPAKARALGRKELSRYMVLPNYRNSWLRQGFTEAE